VLFRSRHSRCYTVEQARVEPVHPAARARRNEEDPREHDDRSRKRGGSWPLPDDPKSDDHRQQGPHSTRGRIDDPEVPFRVRRLQCEEVHDVQHARNYWRKGHPRALRPAILIEKHCRDRQEERRSEDEVRPHEHVRVARRRFCDGVPDRMRDRGDEKQRQREGLHATLSLLVTACGYRAIAARAHFSWAGLYWVGLYWVGLFWASSTRELAPVFVYSEPTSRFTVVIPIPSQLAICLLPAPSASRSHACRSRSVNSGSGCGGSADGEGAAGEALVYRSMTPAVIAGSSTCRFAATWRTASTSSVPDVVFNKNPCAPAARAEEMRSSESKVVSTRT